MNNQSIIQFFHWYHPKQNPLWLHVIEKASDIQKWGFDYVWLPPAYKSAKGDNEPGYAVYDLYDLGEFDQKECIATKHGTKDQYLSAIKTLHGLNIKVIADIVLNHKFGGDEKEDIEVNEVNENDRKQKNEMQLVSAHTKFTFPGRQGKYSKFIWDHNCFTGICYDDKPFIIKHAYNNGDWDGLVNEENGNYDFLMGNDIEFRNPNVREELKNWGSWYASLTHFDGVRLDALKHINAGFFPEWLNHIKSTIKKDFLCIGAYWKNDLPTMLKYIDFTQEKIKLFDVPLHFNFKEASEKKEQYDLRKIFENTLLKAKPNLAITFVDNHDTQPLQSLESFIKQWFKPLAYALILLRKEGFPCVFYPDLYGVNYTDTKDGKEREVAIQKTEYIEAMLYIRKELAYGYQRNYWDQPNLLGWTLEGIDARENSGIAVLINNKDEGQKRMSLGKRNANKSFVALIGNRFEKVLLDENGEGIFFVNSLSCAVWISKQAAKN